MNTKTFAPSAHIDNLAIGKVIAVNGTRFVAELSPKLPELSRVYNGEVYPIGQFGSIVKVHFGGRIIYGMISRLRMKADFQAEQSLAPTASAGERVIDADLFGEGYTDESGQFRFERGVSNYPLPQQTVYLTQTQELRAIYSTGDKAGVCLGTHVGSGDAKCIADMNELIGKHTAILGTTGTGKSGTTAAVIHSILDAGKTKKYKHWTPKIIILDPHGEYGSAFPNARKISTDDADMQLPFWLLDFQETRSLFVGKTEFVAASQVNIVKDALLHARQAGCVGMGLLPNSITVDSPVPYTLEKFLEHVEIAKKNNTRSKDSYDKIINKIATLRRDARLNFMMKEWDGDSDPFHEIIQKLIGADKQPCVVNLSAAPNEIAGTASAVIARTIFNFKVRQTPEERKNSPVLLVCEEAHRYVPNAEEAQYEAAQSAIRRIAKEGRKYGIGLFLVSQRPSEVEATVLSQCNSWIVLRITNSNDKAHVRAILPDTMSGMTDMLSGLRRREAIFVGQAATLPSRILIRDLQESQLPRSHDIDFDKGWQSPPMEETNIKKVISLWRGQDVQGD